MAVSSVDTDRLKDLSKDIMSLANQYDIQITKLFKMLGDVPYTTKEWVGNQAERYFKLVLLDKNDFLDFGNELKRYARKLSEDSDKLDDAIEKTQKDEVKGN